MNYFFLRAARNYNIIPYHSGRPSSEVPTRYLVPIYLMLAGACTASPSIPQINYDARTAFKSIWRVSAVGREENSIFRSEFFSGLIMSEPSWPKQRSAHYRSNRIKIHTEY